MKGMVNLSDRMSTLNRKFNIFVFLSGSALFITCSAYYYANYVTRLPRDLSSIILCGILAAVNYSMPKRQYIHSNAASVFIFGLILYLMWLLFEFFTGLAEINGGGLYTDYLRR